MTVSASETSLSIFSLARSLLVFTAGAPFRVVAVAVLDPGFCAHPVTLMIITTISAAKGQIRRVTNQNSPIFVLNPLKLLGNDNTHLTKLR